MRITFHSLCFAFMSVVLVAETSVAQSLGWAKRAGGTNRDEARAIALDSAGNSYITGIFGTSATFGAGEVNETTLTSFGGQDIFLAKYNSAGALLWARGAGGTDTDEAWGVAVDAAGNSYGAGNLGRFTTVADFGSGVTLTLNGNGNWSFVFVVKYDTAGNAVWATDLGPGGTGFAIAVDSAGNSYLTGTAPDPNLGGGIITNWKVGAGGSPAWVRQPSGVYFGGGTGISVDALNDVYTAGTFSGGSDTFGAGEPNQAILSASDAGEMFIAKYDTAGNLRWAGQSTELPGLVKAWT